jgi:hypothetical protein
MEKTTKINPVLMDPEKYDEHLVEENAEILLKADEIKKDGPMMERIHEFLDKKGKKIKSLRDLKDVANNFSSKKDKKEEMAEDE